MISKIQKERKKVILLRANGMSSYIILSYSDRFVIVLIFFRRYIKYPLNNFFLLEYCKAKLFTER